MNRALLIVLLALAGCGASDPDRAGGKWQPTGANAGNLAAMAARPADLVRGRGGFLGDTRLTSDAIDRLWQDRPRGLPNSSVTTTGISNSGKGS